MIPLRFILILISLLLIVSGQTNDNNFKDADSQKLPDGCLPCDGIPVTCKSCKKNESCVLTTRTCFECPRPKCVKKVEETSTPLWLILTIVGVTVGLVILLGLIGWYFRYRLKAKKSNNPYQSAPEAAISQPQVNPSVVEVFNRFDPKLQSSSNRKSTSSLNFSNFWDKSVPEEESLANIPPRQVKTQIFTQSEFDLILPPVTSPRAVDSDEEGDPENYLQLPPSSPSYTSQASNLTDCTTPQIGEGTELPGLNSNEIAMLKLGQSLARAKSLSCLARPNPVCTKNNGVFTSSDSPLPSPIMINPPLLSPSQAIQFGHTLPTSFKSHFDGYTPKISSPMSRDIVSILSNHHDSKSTRSGVSCLPESPTEPSQALLPRSPTSSCYYSDTHSDLEFPLTS